MVPEKCDGPCGRTLMIWDVKTFWCRTGDHSDDLGEIHLCGDCLPKTKIEVDKDMLLDFKRKEKKLDPVVISQAEHDEFAAAQSAMRREHAGFTEPEPGSAARYDKRKSEHPWWKHTGWWFVHNCVAHVLIGILPFKPFFQFHDWTSRKMHGK